MVTLQVQIQNLGKLADATVRVGPLTVLAGVNNTGKTFFSKSLYSVFGALHADHLMVAFNNRANPLRENLRQMTADAMFASSSPPSVAELVEAVNRMELVAKKCSAEAGNLVANPEEYSAFKEAAQKVFDAYSERLDRALRDWSKQGGMEYSASKFCGEARRLHFLIDQSVGSLRDLGTAGRIADFGFECQVARNFLNNFQVRNFGDLKKEGRDASIHINGECVLRYEDYSVIHAEIPASMLQMRRQSNLFFLESPALWRLKGILESVMLESRNGRTRLDVPEYFRVLLAALPKEYSGEMPFPEIHRRLTEEVIGGKIVRNDLGELRFAESGGGVYPLSRTATGVVNLGILAMLIERKLVDKGTFLFIDEPESNLHPEWQVAMTEALYALARGGVNVVLATHSVDILKRLEIYAKEKDTKDDAANLIAVNHFQRDGTVQNGGVEKIRAVKRDLSAPFFKLYKRGLS